MLIDLTMSYEIDPRSMTTASDSEQSELQSTTNTKCPDSKNLPKNIKSKKKNIQDSTKKMNGNYETCYKAKFVSTFLPNRASDRNSSTSSPEDTSDEELKKNKINLNCKLSDFLVDYDNISEEFGNVMERVKANSRQPEKKERDSHNSRNVETKCIPAQSENEEGEEEETSVTEHESESSINGDLTSELSALADKRNNLQMYDNKKYVKFDSSSVTNPLLYSKHSRRNDLTQKYVSKSQKNDDQLFCPHECLDMASTAINELQENCSSHAEQNSILRDELLRLKEKYNNDISDQNKKNLNAEKAIEVLNKKLDLLGVQNKNIEVELIQSKEYGTKVYKSLTEANRSIENHEIQAKSLNNLIQTLKNKNTQQKDMINNVKQNLALVISKNEKLRDDNQSLLKQNKNLARDTEHLQTELVSTEKELNDSKTKNEKLQTHLQKIEILAQEIKKNNKSFKEERNLLSKLNHEMKNNLEMPVNECKLLRHKNTELLNINTDLKAQIQKLNIKIEEINGHANIELNSLRRELAISREKTARFERQLTSVSQPHHFTVTSSQEKLQFQKESAAYCDTISRIMTESLKLISHEQTECDISTNSTPRVFIEREHSHNSMTNNVFGCALDKDEDNSTPDAVTVTKSMYQSFLKSVGESVLKERDQHWGNKLRDLEEENLKLKGRLATLLP